MKKLLLAALLLFAVPAHAVNVWLGTPFASGGQTWVPIMGNNIPNDLVTIGNINIVTTGSVSLQDEPWYEEGAGNVWPNNYPNIPTAYTSTYYDDIGLGYPEWYVACGYGQVTCDLAASSGMMGAFVVTGSGTVKLVNAVGHAHNCTLGNETLNVSSNVVTVGGGSGGGGGGGGGGHEEGFMAGEEEAPKKATKPRTTWASIKALYR